ncbi:MAG TPA: right-handed parallel beta-helix repeat-containing protein [Opitutus sp.]|nr:right-handed parallel beta-helix repeat-containing protein [Opitutus sp.]
MPRPTASPGLLPLFAIVACFPIRATAAADDGPGPIELVPTFESIGVRVPATQPPDGLTAALSYRAAGDAEWRPALEPVACPAEHEFRGSVLLLAPGTRYEVRASFARSGRPEGEATAVTSTWPENVPVARDVVLPAGTSARPLVITGGGTPDGWIRYRAAKAGSTIDAGTAAAHAVVLDHAAYVIVEGLTVRGGASDAVMVLDSHDVRIGGCDIAGWGDPGRWGYYSDQKHHQWAFLDAAGKMIDHQAGIRVRGAGSTRVVLERNLIHDPRGTANCWAFLHPHGPEGVVLSETGGNNVVRFNDLIAGDGHRWNDAIASEYNGEVIGGPYRDTDIYGNLLVDPNDDGTELDGGQINVRFWNNRLEGGYCGLSCAPNLRGPSYAFRNVIVTADERNASGAGFKMGGDPGVSFLLANTVYTNGHGLTSGHYGRNPSAVFSRDNVFAGPLPGQGRVRFDRSVTGDLDHDLHPPDGLAGTRPRAGREADAVFARPEFLDAAARDFRLARGSAGARESVALPEIKARGDDLGALDASASPGGWPPRPGAPEILPGRVVVRVRAGGSAEVALRARAAAGTPWRAIGGAPWLACALPVRSDGTGQRLLVRIDARGLEPRAHRTFVAVQTATGGLRSVPLEVDVEPAVPATWRFEAENGGKSDDFELVRAADASGGAGMRSVSAAAAAPPLSFEFAVAKPDRFFVLARVRAEGPPAKPGDGDALTLRIDDGPTLTWNLFGCGVGEWAWVRAMPKENINGAFALGAGRHRVRIGAHESHVEVDEIAVSNSPVPPGR